MEHVCIYHFSHFFTLLAEIYFGSSAIFAFFEQKVSKQINKRLLSQIEDVKANSFLINQYIELNPTKTTTQKLQSFLLTFRVWVNESFCNFSHDRTGKKVYKIFQPHYIPKLFTPIFFFGGCFNLMLILVSPFGREYPQYIDNFILLYLASAVVFYLYALTYLRVNINRIDYHILTFYNVLLGFFLLVVSIITVFIFHKYDMHFDIFTSEKVSLYWMSALVVILFFPIVHFFANFLLILLGITLPHYFLHNLKASARKEKSRLIAVMESSTIVDQE